MRKPCMRTLIISIFLILIGIAINIYEIYYMPTPECINALCTMVNYLSVISTVIVILGIIGVWMSFQIDEEEKSK